MTTSEVCQTFNVSRQWLSILRRGQTKVMANGKPKQYKPKLVEGRDWKRVDWKVVYTQKGVERIKSLLRGNNETQSRRLQR